MNRFCSQNPLVQACRWQGPDASHHAGTPSVAVIGAGVSGLNCAKRLQPTCDLVVLEASDGVGGRVRSNREGGYVFDRGFAAASARMVLKRCLSERGGREKRF